VRGLVGGLRIGRNGTAGVTIIEVLIAAIVLGVGLVGVGSMVTYGVVSHRKAVGYTVAAARATEELERVREAGYMGAVVGTELFPANAYTILSSTQAQFSVSELSGGLGCVTISDDPEAQATNPETGSPYGNLKQIQVQVFWQGPGHFSGAYSASTLLANRP
jgi:Tfp pilus assembly protein PilE